MMPVFDFVNASTTCLSLEDIRQVIAGAESAAIAGAGEAIMIMFLSGIVIGALVMYLLIRSDVVHV
jgi:hypothetical protein